MPQDGRHSRKRGRGSAVQASAAFPWRSALAAAVALGLALALYFTFSASDALSGPVRRWTAGLTAFTLDLLGADASVRDATVSAYGSRLLVVADCTPVGPVLLLWGAMLAFPAPWRAKLVGITLGGLLLVALNLVRMVSLVYIGVLAPSYLETVHLLVWQSIMILSAILIWLFWFARVSRVARS